MGRADFFWNQSAKYKLLRYISSPPSQGLSFSWGAGGKDGWNIALGQTWPVTGGGLGSGGWVTAGMGCRSGVVSADTGLGLAKMAQEVGWFMEGGEAFLERGPLLKAGGVETDSRLFGSKESHNLKRGDWSGCQSQSKNQVSGHIRLP